MTFKKMNKRYNEIVELEALDELVGWDNKFIIRILLLFTQKLNKESKIMEEYHFDVIPYGFQGYYPVIGVQYLKK